MTPAEFANILVAKGFKVKAEAGGFRSQCPAHGGEGLNMTIRAHPEGGTVCTCHSHHCERKLIAEAAGRTMDDLVAEPRQANGNGHAKAAPRRFPYRDEQGKALYDIVRIEATQTREKTFAMRLPGAESGGVGDVRRVLFGLPELLLTKPGDLICIAEGEKCALAVALLGVAATTNPNGAGTWRPEYAAWLKEYLPDRRFLVLPDNDAKGKEHALAVCDSLLKAGLQVYLADLGPLPEKGDAVQWIAAGGTAEKLRAMAAPPPQSKRELEQAEERRIISAPDLMAKSFAPLQWAVPDMIPEGLTIFAGGTKTGKSWLSMHIAVAVASGGAVFGHIPVEQGEVLVLALEDSQRRLRDRLEKTLRAEPAPPGLYLVTHWDLLGEGFSERLDAWLLEHPTCRLVIVDVLQKVRPNRKPLGTEYQEDYIVTNALQQVPRDHRVAMVVLHHTRKMTAPDPVDMVSGSVGITGGADSILVLMRQRDQKDATLHTISREADCDAMALEWDGDVCCWKLVGKAADHRLSGERKQVLDFLHRATTPIRPGELAGVLGKNPPAIQYLLSKLADEGLVTKMGGGRYAMTEIQKWSPSE